MEDVKVWFVTLPSKIFPNLGEMIRNAITIAIGFVMLLATLVMFYHIYRRCCKSIREKRKKDKEVQAINYIQKRLAVSPNAIGSKPSLHKHEGAAEDMERFVDRHATVKIIVQDENGKFKELERSADDIALMEAEGRYKSPKRASVRTRIDLWEERTQKIPVSSLYISLCI
jgi:hypothetical protein